MDIKGLDNFKTLIIVFVLISFLYLFVFKQKDESSPVGLERPILKNSVFKESFEVPAPATLIMAPPPVMTPRIVAPSGPNPPNARVPNVVAKENDIYNFIPNDPQDELYGSQNIQDNLRYPERMFGPGILNAGSKLLAGSGVASRHMLNTSQPIQPFATELIQNGGLMGGGIGPDDTQTNPSYASF